MIGWLSKCWSGVGVATEFERARNTTTYADWALPDQKALNIVLSTFKGENVETDAEAAMNSFFVHLEQDEDRRNAAFLLKHLLIMDLVVEERIFLNKIGQYQNNQFLYLQTGANQIVSSSVKDLIASYYQYIRAKAKYYCLQSVEVANKETRQKCMEGMNSVSLLNQINTCFKIQNSILMVSDSFLNGNKSPQIIQVIFSCLLKTYLFCFSIVSLALKTFINRMPILSRYDLQYLSKLANYFSKDYTRNLLLFIERNKLIDNFKSLKYNQLIVLDDKILGIIDSKLRQVQQDNVSFPEPTDLPIQITQSLVIENINSEQIQQRNSQALVRVRRKKLELASTFADEEPSTAFTEYQNLYSPDFIVQEDLASSKLSSKTSNNKKDSEVEKKPRVYTKLSFSSSMRGPDLKKQLSLEQNKKFNKQVWDNWENVYCA